ncbi:MAG: ABC transporter permease subunit [Deltaproteobacteria bacterium]|nr:ABC transporter permease subunit [Deltaproteobacteria bacterium]
MNVPRPTRIGAIARRDLVQELRGRRGWVFGAVTAVLLIPAATLRIDIPRAEDWPIRPVSVTGEVPQGVADLSNVYPTAGPAQIAFRRDADGSLVARTQTVPKEIRAVLDGDTPQVKVTLLDHEMPSPGRSLLFALISASVLTGAVSESIGGERSRRTLQALLSAAITRGEVILGKWLAWAGYGGGVALLAALLAILLGRVEAGWWLLPLPTVAAGTVALAIYLSRHAKDVVGGATVSLRYLPAVLAGTGMVAWYFGDTHPLFGASLPIGGALLAAGNTWPGPATALVATASTLSFSAVALALAARSLEQPPETPASWTKHAWEAFLVAAVAGLSWWAPLIAPMLWGVAGNPVITETLPRGPGVVAGATALLLMSVVRAGRAETPWQDLGLTRPPPKTWLLAAVVGVAIAFTAAVSGMVPLPNTALLSAARIRLAAGLQPLWVGVPGFLLCITAQELLYRGWLLRMVGPALATLVFVLVHGPLDPIRALLVGGSLAAITVAAKGSVLPALLARLVWAAAGTMTFSYAPGTSLVVGVILLGALWVYARTMRAEGPPPS